MSSSKEKEETNGNTYHDDDDDDDDEDYVPNGEEVSEESDAEESETDEEANGGDEEKDKTKSKKRKKINAEEDSERTKHLKVNDLATEKKKADDLWSSFLNDVNAKPKTSQISEPNTTKLQPSTPQPSVVSKKSASVTSVKSLLESTKTNSVDLAKSSNGSDNEHLSKPELPKPKSTGGLASVLERFGQQPKISTLQKSKLDWESFKKSENLEEDLNRHSKGKDSYLERQAFLQRTDLRQFETEKELRDKERKLRQSKN